MYKIGTRIKKVKSRYNLNIGSTGIVVGHVDFIGSDGDRCDIEVKTDQPWVSNTGQKWSREVIGVSNSDYWEPIIPEGSNVPSEMSIHELLNADSYKNVQETI